MSEFIDGNDLMAARAASAGPAEAELRQAARRALRTQARADVDQLHHHQVLEEGALRGLMPVGDEDSAEEVAGLADEDDLETFVFAVVYDAAASGDAFTTARLADALELAIEGAEEDPVLELAIAGLRGAGRGSLTGERFLAQLEPKLSGVIAEARQVAQLDAVKNASVSLGLPEGADAEAKTEPAAASKE